MPFLSPPALSGCAVIFRMRLPATADPRAADIFCRILPGSVFNPSHNNSKIRYEGASNIPAVRPADLRAAPLDYPEPIRRMYLQLPPLDPRVKSLPPISPPARTTSTTKPPISSAI